MAGLPGFGAALIEKSSSAGVAEERSSHLRRSNSQHGGLRERSQRGQRDHPTISGAQGGSKHNTVHGASDYLRTMSNSQHRESSVHGRPSASGVHQGASDQADVPATSLYAPQLRTSNRAMDAAERALEQTLLVIPGQESSHHSHRSFHPSVHGNRDISQRRGGAIHGSLHGSQAYQRVQSMGAAPSTVALLSPALNNALVTEDKSGPHTNGLNGFSHTNGQGKLAAEAERDSKVITLDMGKEAPLKETHTYNAASARAWIINYFKKWLGLPGQGPAPRDEWWHIFWTYIGAFTSIMAIALVHQMVGPNIDLPVLVASFGASAVLLFAVPDGKLSQPRNFVGGQVISSIVGVSIRLAFKDELVWLSSALGMATALLAMQLTRTTHPPGGASALIAASVVPVGAWHGFKFILTILLACAIQLTVALVVNNISSHRRYPMYWW